MIKDWSDLNDFLLKLEDEVGHDANAMIVAADVDRIGIRVHTTPDRLPRPLWYEIEFRPDDLKWADEERVITLIKFDIEARINKYAEEEAGADAEGHEHPGVFESVSESLGEQPRPEQDGDPQEREDRRQRSRSADQGGEPG